MALAFKKAVKYDAKGRIALVGPAGSGKSYTMLTLARALAGPHGRIAAIDTEHGSLSKYADLFDFEVMELDSFTPDNFQEAMLAAEKEKFDVFCCDSLSHFWTGKNGALEFVDMASKKHKDQMGGWKDFRPHERSMVDHMVASSCHVVVTMRTKTEYSEQTDSYGKKKRVKVGLQPVQREGLEYEFDLVGYMDEDNTLLTDKTRCPHYTGKAYTRPGPKEFQPFIDWLKGAKKEGPAVPYLVPEIKPEPTRQEKIEEAKAVGDRKVQEIKAQPKPDYIQTFGNRENFVTRLAAASRPSINLANSQLYEALIAQAGEPQAKNIIGDALKVQGVKKGAELSDEQAADVAQVLYDSLLPQPRHDAVLPKPQSPVRQEPEDVKDLWAAMHDIASTVNVFGALKGQLARVLTPEQVSAHYYGVLKNYGVEHANQFKGDLAKARLAAKDLWLVVDAQNKLVEEGLGFMNGVEK